MRNFGTLARLYIEMSLREGIPLELTPEQSHFLGTVMRKSVGENVRIFNGQYGEWLGEISQLSKRKGALVLKEQLRTPKKCPDVGLVFSPLKKARNNFIIEKATELGVAYFQPVITARTTSKIRMDKIRNHTIEAAEQTERLDLPCFQEPRKLEEVLQTWDENRTLVFADEALLNEQDEYETAVQTLSKIKPPCAILIGPEGGFTEKEREHLRSLPYVKSISLGPRILRADTAALSTLTLWQAVSGDWL